MNSWVVRINKFKSLLNCTPTEHHKTKSIWSPFGVCHTNQCLDGCANINRSDVWVHFKWKKMNCQHNKCIWLVISSWYFCQGFSILFENRSVHLSFRFVFSFCFVVQQYFMVLLTHKSQLYLTLRTEQNKKKWVVSKIGASCCKLIGSALVFGTFVFNFHAELTRL